MLRSNGFMLALLKWSLKCELAITASLFDVSDSSSKYIPSNPQGARFNLLKICILLLSFTLFSMIRIINVDVIPVQPLYKNVTWCDWNIRQVDKDYYLNYLFSYVKLRNIDTSGETVQSGWKSWLIPTRSQRYLNFGLEIWTGFYQLT